MNKALYERYADYYINKFANIKGLTITKKWVTEDILHVEISTSLPSFEFFMGIFPYMICFDGICVCDHGIDFDNIETVDAKKVYKLLDEESELIKTFIKEGIFVFAYKNDKVVVSMSTDVMDREKALKDLNIEKFYNEHKLKQMPAFEELDRVLLKDFYNNIIYEYDAKSK